MISLTTLENLFEPYSRATSRIPWSTGVAVNDLVPLGWPDLNVIAYVNGHLVVDHGEQLSDNDAITLVRAPSDPVTIVGWLVVSVLAVKGAQKLMESMMPEVEPPSDPMGSATYGYFGFKNSYRAEGDPLPIVYGRMRVAPPVINSVVRGSLGPLSGGALSGVYSIGETLMTLLAVSEGPIYGFGRYLGPAATSADVDAFIASFSGSSQGTELMVNGIQGAALNANVIWRTGELAQEGFTGASAPRFATEPTQTYLIGLKPQVGGVHPSGSAITDLEFPPGSYANGSSSLLQAQDGEYAEVFVKAKADSASIKILFDAGLYEQNQDTGQTSFDNNKIIRVQFRETDASGTGTGDWALLPAGDISSPGNTTPFTWRASFDLIEPDTYVPPVSQGYYTCASVSSQILRSNEQLRWMPFWLDVGQQQFTIAAWVQCYDWSDSYSMAVFGVTSGTSGSVQIQASDTFWELECGSGETAFGVFIQTDPNYVVAEGQDQIDSPVVVSLQIGNPASNRGVRYVSQYLGSSEVNRWKEDQWNHIAVTYDGLGWVEGVTPPSVTLFLNGNEIICPMVPRQANAEFGYDGGLYTFPEWNNPNGSRIRLGGWQDETSTNIRYDSRIRLCQFLLSSRVLSAAEIYQLGNAGGDYGGLGTDVRAFANDYATVNAVPMDVEVANGGDYYYRSYRPNSDNTSAPTEANGDLKQRTHAGASSSGGPVYSTQSGSPKASYWQIQAFCSNQSSGPTDLNEATFDLITATRSDIFTYPSTALAAVSVGADSQVSDKTPSLTLEVRGRIVNTWEGGLVDGEPALTAEWSQNPAWIAADLLVNKRYGLGADFDKRDLDWPSFRQWALFCDEGVADAFGSLEFFGVDAGSADTPGANNAPNTVGIYIGLIDTSDVSYQSIPDSWTVRDAAYDELTHAVSIQSVTENGLNEEWVTANDIVDGLNGVSNQLGIYDIQYMESADFHGWKSYAIVYAVWHRSQANGNEDWPTGVTDGAKYFADSYGLSSFGKVSGYEPRCRFDGVFDQIGDGGWTSLLKVFTAGRAMPVKAGQKIYARVDAPKEPMAAFGQGNIVTGSLKLNFLGPGTQPNQLEGDILDSQANFERATILVDHPSLQNPSSNVAVRKESVDLIGVTRRSQAIRDCTYRLNRYHLIRRRCVFEVGPDAVNLLPGDRFRLSHDVPQYGFSGRLRLGAGVSNIFPGSGSDLTTTWDVNEGNCSMSEYGYASAVNVDRPSGFTTSTVRPVDMRGLPMSTGGKLAALTGNSGADGVGLTPWWATQHAATSPALYPPNGVEAVLDTITSTSYQSAFSAYVKEADFGAAEYVRMNIYRYVDSGGTLIDASTAAVWRWASGSLTNTATDTGVTASTTSIGSGWYRIGIVYSASAAPTPGIGDCIQAKTYAYGGATSVGTFLPVADGGKGTNFLEYGDPMDASKTGSWTHYNGTTSSNSIANSTQRPPFYQSTTGTHGHVVRMKKASALGAGTTPPCLVQTHTLTTGSAVSSWNGERVCFTGFVRLAATNTSVDTSFYVDIRAAATVDSNNLLSGDGIRAKFTSNPTWAASTKTEVEAAGAVANFVSSIAPVVQNSNTNDTHWQQINISFDYTPSSGTLAALSLGVWTDGTVAGDQVVEFWGFRLHGASSGGSLINPWYHRGAVFWGHQYESDTSSISTLSTGVAVKLDRDVTLEADKTYELLVRSSFQPDPSVPRDSQEVLLVDSSQVPSSGSTTIAANTSFTVSSPVGFTAREGDLYSFGETGSSSADFVVDSISLDSETMHREIQGTEYNEAIYDDTAFGEIGRTTISSLPDPSAENAAMAEYGVGWGGTSGTRAVGFNLSAYAEALVTADGGTVGSVTISWSLDEGTPLPLALQFYLKEDGKQTPDYIGETSPAMQSFSFTNDRIEDGKTYKVFVRPVGSKGSLTSVLASTSVDFVATLAPRGGSIPAPTVTAAIKGTEQVYKVSKSVGAKQTALVEGRIGGWILGSTVFDMDSETEFADSPRTLVGQASTATGDTGMRLFSRGRTASGYYGPLAELLGDEQIPDVGYTKSVATENDYAANGTKSSELAISSNVLTWDSGSSALTGTYTPATITLSKAQRVYVNCQVAGTQVRPEALEDCKFTLGGATGKRWSLEGPMDDLGNDNTEVQIQWKYGSSSLSSAFTDFEPGIVYAKVIQFQVTFTRPNKDYDMRITRILSQALTLPTYEAGDIDGGTF